MTAVPCTVSDELLEQINNVRNNHETNDIAVIAKCNLKDAEVQLVEVLEGKTSEEIAEELPEDSRFIFYRFKRNDFPSTWVFLWYNPGDLRPDIARTYQNEAFKFETQFGIHCVKLTFKNQFKTEWLVSMTFGLQGKMKEE